MNSNKGGVEFVGCSLSVDADTANVNVNFDGSYPVEVGGHTVFLSRRRDEMRFFCTLCQEGVSFSEAVWRSSKPEEKRKASEFAFGYFYESGCSPGEIQDTIENVIGHHLGRKATPQTMRSIKEELKYELTGYG